MRKPRSLYSFQSRNTGLRRIAGAIGVEAREYECAREKMQVVVLESRTHETVCGIDDLAAVLTPQDFV